ncbi:MAG TPA: methyltransferase domain-containing protein [Candidatus Saccharimonadales bacterium]|nr:methyltransferase domain-containing protein [Candidatus Saccharimonadales bacterium]
MIKNRIKKTAKKLLGRSKGKVMLNVGCGTDYKKGWINIDNNSDNNIKKLDLNWDLRNPLPYDEGSVDFIFNEHLIEHLTPEEGQVVIKDLMRVLKPGGVLRMATPNLAEVVEQYGSLPIDKDPTIKRFKLTYIKTRAERINIAFREWGHKWLYDTEELQRRIEEAGYKKIAFCKLRESTYPELRNLEIREESNLIAEVTK